MIASPGPGRLIRCGQQGIDLWAGQEIDQGSSEALAGDREHALNLGGMLGCFEGGIAKKGMNCREAQVAAADKTAKQVAGPLQQWRNFKKDALPSLNQYLQQAGLPPTQLETAPDYSGLNSNVE